ncbi:MAG: hypothetical protein IH934_00445 [Nanoarchaeota archaeon]|nr:hypothetical protein [Nanoarchaeota archaeon]
MVQSLTEKLVDELREFLSAANYLRYQEAVLKRNITGDILSEKDRIHYAENIIPEIEQKIAAISIPESLRDTLDQIAGEFPEMDDLALSVDTLARTDWNSEETAFMKLHFQLDEWGYFLSPILGEQAKVEIQPIVERQDIPGTGVQLRTVSKPYHLNIFEPTLHGFLSFVGERPLEPIIYRFSDNSYHNFVEECAKGAAYDCKEAWFPTREDFQFDMNYYMDPQVNQRLRMVFKPAGQLDITMLNAMAEVSGSPESMRSHIVSMNQGYRWARMAKSDPRKVDRDKLQYLQERLVGNHEAHHYQAFERELDYGKTEWEEHGATAVTLAYDEANFDPLLSLISRYFVGEPMFEGDICDEKLFKLMDDVLSSAQSRFRVTQHDDKNIAVLSLLQLNQAEISLIGKDILKQTYGKPYEDVFGQYQSVM